MWDADWWEQAGFPLLNKTRTYRGTTKILAEELIGTGYYKYGIELVLKALDQLVKDQEKKEKLDTLKAKAAASDKEARQLANAIKKQLANQIRILKVCPYCGEDLQLESAHADHIYPVSKGGHSTNKNMVYVCAGCNMKKKNHTLSQFIKNW